MLRRERGVDHICAVWINGLELRLLMRVFGCRKVFQLAVTVLLVSSVVPATAGDDWSVEHADGIATSAGPVPETRRRAPGGLPDGLVATHRDGNIRSAWYDTPTSRYGHAILGDGVEAGSLIVSTPGGQTMELVLPESEVFEDRYPRLADLDNDGSVEVITIRSSLSMGASVTIYGLESGRLVERASTGFIGRANRWLNIAGIADFDGIPGKEIAFVRTPHIGGTLFYFSYSTGSLSMTGAMDGFSNHVIGSTEMRLSAVADINGDGRDDLALPSNDRRTLRIVGFDRDGPVEFARIPLPARIDKAIGVEGSGSNTAFIVGLDNQSTVRISR